MIQDTFDLKMEYLESTIMDIDEIMTEKKDEPGLFTKIKIFFAKILSSLATLKDDIERKIKAKFAEKDLKKQIEQLKLIAEDKAQKGETTMDFPDFEAYAKRYTAYKNDVRKFAAKFGNCMYDAAWQVQDDLTLFDNKTAIAEKELEKISKRKVSKKVSWVITFCEDELRGKGNVMKTINDGQKIINEVKTSALKLEKKTDVLKDDIRYLKITALQKIAAKFTKMIKVVVVKVIMMVLTPFAYIHQFT